MVWGSLIISSLIGYAHFFFFAGGGGQQFRFFCGWGWRVEVFVDNSFESLVKRTVFWGHF